jgi:hypothetical protein
VITLSLVNAAGMMVEDRMVLKKLGRDELLKSRSLSTPDSVIKVFLYKASKGKKDVTMKNRIVKIIGGTWRVTVINLQVVAMVKRNVRLSDVSGGQEETIVPFGMQTKTMGVEMANGHITELDGRVNERMTDAALAQEEVPARVQMRAVIAGDIPRR